MRHGCWRMDAPELKCHRHDNGRSRDIGGGSSPSCWEKPCLLFRVRGEGRRVKARGPKGRQRGWGLLGKGAASLLPTSWEVWGIAVSSSSGVGGGAPAAKRFSCILEEPDSLSWNLLGAKFGGHGPLPPSQSAYGNMSATNSFGGWAS